MWPRDEVVRVLRARGELWDVAPGVTALRGDAALLLRAIERTIAAVCELETSDEWHVPPAIDFATLARAEYFASFKIGTPPRLQISVPPSLKARAPW